MAAASSHRRSLLALLLLALLAAAALAQEPPQPEPEKKPVGLCPGFEPTLGMANYTANCNACFSLGCGICSPPANKANQLGEASCLIDETYCHNPRFFKADDKHAASICHVTIIPFAAVIGVLVALVLCCGGCTGYCCYTLQKQRKLKRMIKAKQAFDQQQQAAGVAPPQAPAAAIESIPQPRSDAVPVATPTARNV